jgi:hypothetical protein
MNFMERVCLHCQQAIDTGTIEHRLVSEDLSTHWASALGPRVADAEIVLPTDCVAERIQFHADHDVID